MNEFELRDELREKRNNIKTFEDLVEFLTYVKDNCNCGYGEAPRAMAQACLAVGYYLSDEFGLTGFQAGFVMWDFIHDWQYRGNECGLRIIDFDKMLYPQYDYQFEKTISKDTWEALQRRAKEELEDRDSLHPNVEAHMQSIADGKVPFGYTVSNR